MGESSAVKAQRLANESNQLIAEKANDFNKMMQEYQNSWNLDRRNEEWAYNDPSAQMERYIKAGINPLWAMSSGDAGKAQQLTSAPAQPAAVAHVEPEFDPLGPQRVGNILSASQQVANDAMGFYKLSLEHQDVDTRKRAQASQEALARADAAFKKSQTAGQDFLNNLNLKTADSLIGIKQREYEQLGVSIDNAKKEGKSIDEQVLNLQETRKQIIAMTDYTYKQADALVQQVAQGWRGLAIQQQNANTSQFAAQSQSYYQGEDLKLRGKQFTFDVNKTALELHTKSNDQLIKFYGEKRGYLGRLLGNLDPTDKLTNLWNPTTEKQVEKMFVDIQAAGKVLHQRYIDNPSMENYKSYMEWQNDIQNLPQVPTYVPDKTFSPTPPSILNPSVPWQQ